MKYSSICVCVCCIHDGSFSGAVLAEQSSYLVLVAVEVDALQRVSLSCFVELVQSCHWHADKQALWLRLTILYKDVGNSHHI